MNQLTLGMARNTDPATSHAAAALAQFKASPNRMLALRRLATVGGYGATDFELAAVTGVQQTSIGKRRFELMGAGLVTKRELSDGSTCTRTTPSGAAATVWTITALGVKWLREHDCGRAAA